MIKISVGKCFYTGELIDTPPTEVPEPYLREIPVMPRKKPISYRDAHDMWIDQYLTDFFMNDKPNADFIDFVSKQGFHIDLSLDNLEFD